MYPLTTLDPSLNFWKANPQFLIPEEFNKLYNQDKSKNKEESSTLMWGICLYTDQKESKFIHLSPEDRKQLIFHDILKRSKDKKQDDKFFKETFEPLSKQYEKYCLTSAERQILQWSKFMDQKTEYLQTLNYKDNGEEIEKLLLSNGKLFTELERLSSLLVKEGSEGLVKGNVEESSSEKGEI